MGTLIFFFFRVSFTQHLLRLCSFSTVSSFDLLHLLLLLLHLCRRRLFVVVFVYPIFLPWAYLWFGKTKQNINKFEKKNSVTSRVFFRKLPSPKTLTSRRLSLSLSLSLSLFKVPLVLVLCSSLGNRTLFRLFQKQRLCRTLFFRPSPRFSFYCSRLLEFVKLRKKWILLTLPTSSRTLPLTVRPTC